MAQCDTTGTGEYGDTQYEKMSRVLAVGLLKTLYSSPVVSLKKLWVSSHYRAGCLL